MRTFAQKPKVAQQAASAKSALPGRARFGHTCEVSSILHLQRTHGNQLLRGVGLVLVRAVQPVGQAASRFVRRLAVEGHHRRRHAGNSEDLRAPALGVDQCHLDQVTTARNHSFKPMAHDVR